MKIEEYEKVCPICDGTGVYKIELSNRIFICEYCDGKGKLDWIDKIKRKDKNEN